MSRRVVVAAFAVAALVAPRAEAVGAVTAPTIPVTSGPARDGVGAEACATTQSGRRLACVEVRAGKDGEAQATLCAYDDALGILAWAADQAVLCFETTDDWGYVEAPGLCERALGLDRPQTCVNGRDSCLLWVMSVRIVCRTS